MYTGQTIRQSLTVNPFCAATRFEVGRTETARQPMTQFDPEALARMLAGDDAAIANFVATMTPVIQARAARCLLKGTPRDIRRDVEDFCQDVYAHLFADNAKVMRRYDGTQGLSLRNYVGLVAQRRVIAQLRSSKHNPWRESVSLEDEPIPLCTEGSPERTASGQSSLDALLNHMRDSLSPLAWRLFQLLYVRDLSVKEVCTETGLTSEAVYAWRSRLRKAARTAQTALTPGTAPP